MPEVGTAEPLAGLTPLEAPVEEVVPDPCPAPELDPDTAVPVVPEMLEPELAGAGLLPQP